MAPCGHSNRRLSSPNAGATAAVLLCALALKLDPASSFAGPAGTAAAAVRRSNSFTGRRQRYRPAESSPPSSRRRGIPAAAAAPSSSTPPSKQRPNKKKGGVGTVKFSGGRVTRPVQPAKDDSEEEEDARKSARWGVKPPAPAKMLGVVDAGAFKNPLSGVGSSLRKASGRRIRMSFMQKTRHNHV